MNKWTIVAFVAGVLSTLAALYGAAELDERRHG